MSTPIQSQTRPNWHRIFKTVVVMCVGVPYSIFSFFGILIAGSFLVFEIRNLNEGGLSQTNIVTGVLALTLIILGAFGLAGFWTWALSGFSTSTQRKQNIIRFGSISGLAPAIYAIISIHSGTYDKQMNPLDILGVLICAMLLGIAVHITLKIRHHGMEQ